MIFAYLITTYMPIVTLLFLLRIFFLLFSPKNASYYEFLSINRYQLGTSENLFAIFSMNGHESTDFTFPVLRRYGGLRREPIICLRRPLLLDSTPKILGERGVTIRTPIDGDTLALNREI